MSPVMYELWQTEWCPSSRRVRQRLTELGIDFVARQVPADRGERTALVERTGVESIPVLVAPDGEITVGEAPILVHLDARRSEPEEARAHQLRAEMARRRYLEEECECPEPATR